MLGRTTRVVEALLCTLYELEYVILQLKVSLWIRLTYAGSGSPATVL